MKAVLIDVKKQEIKEVEYDDNIRHLASLLECDMFTVPAQLENGDALYVDDESLLKDPATLPGAFLFEDYPYQPLFGHGLILGTDDEGESQDYQSKIEKIKDKVTFFTMDKVDEIFTELKNKPIEVYFENE